MLRKINSKLTRLLFRRSDSGYFLKNDKYYISFSFDDFPQSAALYGTEILDKYDIRATFYVSLGILGMTYYEKKMATHNNIIELHEKKHELGCHTYDHIDLQTVPKSKAMATIEKNAIEMKKIIPHYNLDTFAFPRGRVTVFSKRIVDKKFRCSRTTIGGVNTGKIDLNMLKANELYSETIPIEQTYNLIDQLISQKGWLIFYTHDVEKYPSNFGCTPTYFEKVVKYAVSSGAKILPVNEIVNMLNSADER